VVKKEFLVHASGGDHKPLECLPADKTGTVPEHDFQAFLLAEHKSRSFPKIEEADEWHRNFLSVLRIGSGAEPPPPQYQLSDKQAGEAGHVFAAVAALRHPAEDAAGGEAAPTAATTGTTAGDARLWKESLVLAHGGDFGLFERIDSDMSGTVTEAQWLVSDALL